MQRLTLRRGELGSHMRQFMQRFDLLVDAVRGGAGVRRPAGGHVPMTPEAMLGWTPFSLPVQPHAAAGVHRSRAG